MKKTVIMVQADHNDGDYVDREEDATPKLIKLAKKVAEAIKEKNRAHKQRRQHFYNWATFDRAYEDKITPYQVYDGILTEEEIEIFMEELCPSEEHGIHTITSIRIVEIVSDEELL